ncbi:hypothetical protein R3W88_016373 [Solanum pinnatisectum]|uniref:Uncharacterized protein n=1 Tax=Solanum pinnatisectum TaxID=50273 RepID=A0AAV9KZK7_9SOLN|nr:hypothetical protein R3W88_016373 [Solanum pinnatisectum]
MPRKSKSQMTLKTAIPGGKIASKLFDEPSHSGFNFDESKNSIDSSNSTKVNSLMVDATDMDEKFAMMEQTIKALKMSIDEKNLQIAELMGKLDLYNSGESHHILTTQEKVDIGSPANPVDSQSAKHSGSVATLTVQQLQDMIVNTIKAQYRGLPQNYPFLDSNVPAILDELLTKKVIALPESKRPKESNKFDDPMYCKFHRIIREGKIIIDDAETVEINHASVKLDHKKYSISEVLRLVVSPKIEEGVIIVQFGSFELVEVFALKKTTNKSKVDDFSNKKNDDTWILVARQRKKHQGTSKLRLSKVDTK